MPARKPSSLHKRHATRAERTARATAEGASMPLTALPIKPPALLARCPVATDTWKRLRKLYGETEGQLVTAFDQDLLIKVCLAEEELVELQSLRRDIKKLWQKALRALNKIHLTPDNLGDYYSALAQANALLSRFQGMDARLDTKRKMLLSMEQALYLTPRSRSGAAPAAKAPAPPEDDLEKLLKE